MIVAKIRLSTWPRYAGVLAVLWPLAAVAQTSTEVRVEHPWARATAPRQIVAGAYITLTSRADDRLVGVSSPVAGHAEVHEMTMDGGVMRMRELADGLALPAGRTVTLAPGGSHLMLTDLHEPLREGQTIHLQLRFLHAPPLEVDVPVASVGARTAP